MGARHDWAGIERAARVDRLRPSEIARRFGVPLSTFYYRARREDWPLPLDGPAAGADGSGREGEQGLVTRLTRVALKRLIELEQGAGAKTPEAAVKAVEGVLKLVERIETLEAAGGGQQRKPMTPEEKERMRESLAAQVHRTLDRLRSGEGKTPPLPLPPRGRGAEALSPVTIPDSRSRGFRDDRVDRSPSRSG
ncbi:MAG: hypothetical protein AB7S41_01510 [Parvibaculaceae bacterium]